MKFINAQFVKAVGTAEQLRQLRQANLPQVAFCGRSNVGKSSLINKLLNRKSLARTSSVPGKTGTINYFKVDECYFVDLPGYGYAKVPQSEKLRWARLMQEYFDSYENLRLVVQLIDMRHAPTKMDMQMIDLLYERGLSFVIALTKCDKLSKTQRLEQMSKMCELFVKYEGVCVVAFSAVKGDGVQQLREIIERAVEGTGGAGL